MLPCVILKNKNTILQKKRLMIWKNNPSLWYSTFSLINYLHTYIFPKKIATAGSYFWSHPVCSKLSQNMERFIAWYRKPCCTKLVTLAKCEDTLFVYKKKQFDRFFLKEIELRRITKALPRNAHVRVEMFTQQGIPVCCCTWNYPYCIIREWFTAS